MPRGRPSIYTQELADRICQQIMDCVPLHKIEKMPGMPRAWTILRWADEKPEFCVQYTRARELQAHRMVADTLAIADAKPTKLGGVEQARLRVQTRQWAAERMASKRYGARVKNEITGADGAPFQVVLNGVSGKL